MVAARRSRCAVSLTVLLAAAGSGCGQKTSAPPSEFGVNVVVNARLLAADVRARIDRGVLTPSGSGAGAPNTIAVSKSAIGSGELRFRYIPSITSGELALRFDALAGAEPVASGQSDTFSLVPGKAVLVTIELRALPGADAGVPEDGAAVKDAPGPGGDTRDGAAKKANGEPCTPGTASECGSGICADGVCCNLACRGSCESCAIAGRRGTCEPVPIDTDPDNECPAVTAAAPDGGVSDGGASSDGSPLRAPDGGLVPLPATCKGSCNGMRACKYPGPQSSCGTKWCNAHSEVGALVCDGKGGCVPGLSECVDYACNAGACRIRCAAHEECQPGKTYCNASNQCALKKGNGLGCVTGDECRSGFCAGGVCCNSACESPFTCTQTPGQCRCPGVTCAAGVACQVYYRDADGDGFGDKFGTIDNGAAAAACAGSPPAGTVADNQDCDDGDANAKPGQKGFFNTPSRIKGTYDYDCDGKLVKEIPENLGSVCKFCTAGSTFGSCGTPQSTCKSADQTAGLACGVICTRSGSFFFCYCGPYDGFVAAPDCGVAGDFRVCGKCNLAGEFPSGSYTYSRKQACN